MKPALRRSLFGGLARLDAVGFYADFEDYQLNTFNGISFVVENIQEVISSGFEIDLAADVSEQITLTGAITRANTRYGDDIVSAVRSSNGLPLNGRQITLAPRWSASPRF